MRADVKSITWQNPLIFVATDISHHHGRDVPATMTKTPTQVTKRGPTRSSVVLRFERTDLFNGVRSPTMTTELTTE